MPERLARTSRLASLACLWAAGTGLCLITLLVLYQVLMRYAFQATPAWSEQAALYLLVWTVLIGAAAGVRERFHIRIEAGQDALPPKARRRAILSAHVVTGLIGVFLVVYGAQLVATLWPYAIPTLGLPRGSAFLPLPVAGLLIAAFSAEHVLALRRGEEVLPLWR